MAAFSDSELISDYNFLEEAALLRDSSARDTQRMLQSQKHHQLRQLQTSVSTSLHRSQGAAKGGSGTEVCQKEATLMKITVQRLCIAYCESAAAGCRQRGAICILPYAAAHSVLSDR